MEIDPRFFKRQYTFEFSDREIDVILHSLQTQKNLIHENAYRPTDDMVNFFYKLSRSNAVARKHQDMRDPFQRGDL